MKLIPEQIINLRKKLINQDNFIYKEYIDDIKNNKADDMFKIAYHDYSTENMQPNKISAIEASSLPITLAFMPFPANISDWSFTASLTASHAPPDSKI